MHRKPLGPEVSSPDRARSRLESLSAQRGCHRRPRRGTSHSRSRAVGAASHTTSSAEQAWHWPANRWERALPARASTCVSSKCRPFADRPEDRLCTRGSGSPSTARSAGIHAGPRCRTRGHVLKIVTLRVPPRRGSSCEVAGLCCPHGYERQPPHRRDPEVPGWHRTWVALASFPCQLSVRSRHRPGESGRVAR